MSREELAEIARKQGLGRTAQLIERFHTPELFARQFPEDARLTMPAHFDPLHVVRQMTRRGLHPALLRPVLVWLKDRPLERALVAWDALSSTVINDPQLVEELRAAATSLKDQLPAPGRACIDLNAHTAETLIPASLQHTNLVALFVMVNEHSLEALAELARRKDPLIKEADALASFRALARVLHLGHLPSLAAVYLDYLARALEFRPAAHDLCETMFDADAPQRLSGDTVRPGDLPPDLISDYAEYITYRSYLSLVDARQLYGLMDQNFQKRPSKMPPPSAQLQVVRAHVSALVRKKGPLSIEDIDRICNESKTWRYAARVRVVIMAQLSPPRSPAPLTCLHDYVTGFGNDLHTAYEALMVGPPEASWKQEILPLLVREARALPHEPGVWRAMVMMLGDQLGVLEAMQEMQKKIEEQSRL